MSNRERAWTDGQKLARVRELAELWKAGDFEERECAEKLLAILDAAGGPVDRSHDYVQSKEHGGCAQCGYPEWEPWHRREQGATH
jgi:hypothetical protein